MPGDTEDTIEMIFGNPTSVGYKTRLPMWNLDGTLNEENIQNIPFFGSDIKAKKTMERLEHNLTKQGVIYDPCKISKQPQGWLIYLSAPANEENINLLFEVLFRHGLSETGRKATPYEIPTPKSVQEMLPIE